ncbi:MAG: hypothetical protein JWO35_472 [Candidatus Saccharibacteria bacterium]|nr:hypothetical protein [Candidatus Saccharibacteria bacterium]
MTEVKPTRTPEQDARDAAAIAQHNLGILVRPEHYGVLTSSVFVKYGYDQQLEAKIALFALTKGIDLDSVE